VSWPVSVIARDDHSVVTVSRCRHQDSRTRHHNIIQDITGITGTPGKRPKRKSSFCRTQFTRHWSVNPSLLFIQVGCCRTGQETGVRLYQLFHSTGRIIVAIFAPIQEQYYQYRRLMLMTALTIVKPAILANLACLLLSESFHLEVIVGVVTAGCVTQDQ
jgi:hypothetical protein